MKISPIELPVSVAKHQHFFKNVFYCIDKRISDINTYIEIGIEQCEMDCSKEHL